MLIVNNQYNQNLLNVNGYFTMPFLSLELVDQIKSIYYIHFNGVPNDFYASSFSSDVELKKKISDKILSILENQLDSVFKDYKILGSSFLLKNPNSNKPLPLHQDWTVTDEEKFGSYTIWIPLQDTNQKNGAIRVIDGSHKVENNLRAPSLPAAFEGDKNLFEDHLKTLNLSKGEAFVFNQKLMHASWQNTSNEDRLAVTIGLVPKDADLFMLYFNKNKNEIQQYAMPDNFFLHYPEIIDHPKIGTLEKSFSYQPKKFTEKELNQNLYQNRIQNATMQPLFSDKNHQEFFEQNGYLKINALDENDIKELTDYLFESGIKKENDYGFYVGMDHENKELVSQMMQKVESIAMPKLAPFLQDYQLITASYVIKDPNPKGVVPPHQDWTFVEDEIKHCSVTCWITLVDTNMENGCLGVIKGSHKFFNSVRPSPSPQVPSPLAKHMFSLFPYFELMPMKAGEALIFDNRTFHSSPPNITDTARLAVGLSFTQKEAQLRHYYLKPGTKNTLLKYKIDSSFFMKYDNGTLAKMYDAGKKIEDYELMEEVKFSWEDLSKEELKQRVLNAGNVYNNELTNHMMKLFGEQMKEKTAGFLSAFNPLNIVRKIREKMA